MNLARRRGTFQKLLGGVRTLIFDARPDSEAQHQLQVKRSVEDRKSRAALGGGPERIKAQHDKVFKH